MMLPNISGIDSVDENDSLYFQHDGTSPHLTLGVQNLLNENFPGRWIGSLIVFERLF